MSASWAQGGQFQGPPRASNGNRPPICFNCSREGHFMVACPEPPRQAPNSFGPPAPQYQQYTGPAPPPQSFPPQGGPVQPQYPNYPPNQQYGPPVPQYSYAQVPPPQQPYAAPVTPQYGHPGYQQSPHNPYAGPPQYSGPVQPSGPQQYGPPQPPAPYQPPPNVYQPQNDTYHGGYGPPHSQAPPQRWNNTPQGTSTGSTPPYQYKSRAYSKSGYHSATPSFQAHSQPRQERRGSQNFQQAPLSNVGSTQQPTPRATQYTPSTPLTQSKPSSQSSTPSGHHKSTVTKIPKEKARSQTRSPAKDDQFSSQQQDEEEPDYEQQFQWDLKQLFKEAPTLETVALAQPLSTNFGMTPVPLLDARSSNSVSRYARKDNLKEFVRSIRTAPQWSFLKEDPAFSDIKFDAPLIPLDEIPAWTAARHGIEESFEGDVETSRKRGRSAEPGDEQEHVQEHVDNQIVLDVVQDLQDDAPPSKRRREEKSEDRQGTPMITTPTLAARAGTPCFETDDGVWAPQPGEGAISETATTAEEPAEDPTEALLASLGVTGAPKPVKQESPPPFQAPSEEQAKALHDTPAPFPPSDKVNDQAPPTHPPNYQPPPHQSYSNAPAPQTQFNPAPNPSYANPPHFPQQSNPTVHPYGNGQHYQHQFSPPANPLYHNGVPPNELHNNAQYGPPKFPPYGPLHRGNPQHGPPMNHPHPNGPVANGSYNVAPHNHAPQNSTGPSQGGPYNHQAYEQPPTYNSGPVNGHGNGMQGGYHYPNGPPNQPPYGQSSPPSRQDSGYMSAGGSHGNSSGQNAFESEHISPRDETSKTRTSAGNIEGPATHANTPMSRSTSNTGDQDGSPLSPMSQEILGKLSRPDSKLSNGKKVESSRQLEDVRKPKRPAPVVAEAYSRRW